MTRTPTVCLAPGAIAFFWLHALVSLAQDAPSQPRGSKSNQGAAPDLKDDPRLKVPITTNFKKPKVRDLLDSLEKATGLKFSANEMVEMKEEGFGSVSFRNTPAWIVMQELAKSDAAKGRWEKTADGYMLVGTLDAKAQAERVAELKKNAPVIAQTPEPPVGSSNQFWIFVAIMAIPGVALAGWIVVRRRRKNAVGVSPQVRT
jgi:hypothetical protein